MIDASEAGAIFKAIDQVRARLIEKEDRKDSTVDELLGALDVAWIAAARLRLEREGLTEEFSANEGFV